jgi:hypothetical protein
VSAKEPGARTITVFISSTFLDNEERRRLVEDAVVRAGMMPVGMEHFTASHRPTVEVCQKRARECDLYVGIVAHRYGWIPPGETRSITELEYDAAAKAHRPMFMFEIDRDVRVKPDEDFDEGEDRWDKQRLLEAFRKKFAGDQLPTTFTELTLGTKVLHALYTWRDEQATGTSSARQGPKDDQTITEYRARAEELHSTIKLAGFKTPLRVPMSLEDLWVPLHAMVSSTVSSTVGGKRSGALSAAENEERLGQGGGAENIALVEAFREAKQRGRRGVVLLGDPGSGKTTQLRRLLLACLRDGPETLGLEAGTLPVFLPLRRLHAGSAWRPASGERAVAEPAASGEPAVADLVAFVEQVLAEEYTRAPRDLGRRLLARGRLLLLFDGLDEVANVLERKAVTKWIGTLVPALDACVPVVTCRFAGYTEGARFGDQFLELAVRPLTREQSDDFIRRWYRAVETAASGDPAWRGETRLGAKAEELVTQLGGADFRVARLVEMTRNPLLLTNLCLVHYDRGQLSRGRARLYEECVNVLLERWRKEAGGLPVTVTTDDGRRVLQPAALWLHEAAGRTRATADELEPQLAPALEAVHWKGGGAREFLKTVRDESGLLTGWGQDQFGFMHLGFQEYLAATEIRRRHFEGDASRLPELAARFGSSWWQEVILLLVASGNPSAFVPFLRELMKRPEVAQHPALLDALLEDAAEASPVPFVELLRGGTREGPRSLGAAVRGAACARAARFARDRTPRWCSGQAPVGRDSAMDRKHARRVETGRHPDGARRRGAGENHRRDVPDGVTDGRGRARCRGSPGALGHGPRLPHWPVCRDERGVRAVSRGRPESEGARGVGESSIQPDAPTSRGRQLGRGPKVRRMGGLPAAVGSGVGVRRPCRDKSAVP